MCICMYISKTLILSLALYKVVDWLYTNRGTLARNLLRTFPSRVLPRSPSSKLEGYCRPTIRSDIIYTYHLQISSFSQAASKS